MTDHRAEDEYDWPDTSPVTGAAQVASNEADSDEYPLGTLWLPNPDTRYGWEMRHVWRSKPNVERTLGFRRHR